MVDFKIGDRVRAVVADAIGWDIGYETDIVAGHLAELGVIDRGGSNRYFCDTEWVLAESAHDELAEPAHDELAELRAFKEAAIAKHPDLAPVDPDFQEVEAILFANGWGRSSPDRDIAVVCLECLQRGRELERYAQGLTTSKD